MFTHCAKLFLVAGWEQHRKDDPSSSIKPPGACVAEELQQSYDQNFVLNHLNTLSVFF